MICLLRERRLLCLHYFCPFCIIHSVTANIMPVFTRMNWGGNGIDSLFSWHRPSVYGRAENYYFYLAQLWIINLVLMEGNAVMRKNELPRGKKLAAVQQARAFAWRIDNPASSHTVTRRVCFLESTEKAAGLSLVAGDVSFCHYRRFFWARL